MATSDDDAIRMIESINFDVPIRFWRMNIMP